MGSLQLPPMLTIKEEEEFDPADRYGNPIKVTVIISFGEYEVARYELIRSIWGSEYFEDKDHVRYDDTEELVAAKLKKLFEMIEVIDRLKSLV